MDGCEEIAPARITVDAHDALRREPAANLLKVWSPNVLRALVGSDALGGILAAQTRYLKVSIRISAAIVFIPIRTQMSARDNLSSIERFDQIM
jgi:hypothetical protein